MQERARLGMAMFLLSETVLFSFLIIGVVYFKEPAGMSDAGILFTILLAASGITMWRAASGTAVRWWLAATILPAAAWLGVQGLQGFPPSAALLTLVGCHELHVGVGILLLGIALWRGSPVFVKTIALYWYFVVVVWLVIVVLGFVL